jgi:glycosyltransferase involved in cell wall biosynthesis
LGSDITVVIPAYNAAKFIGETLDTVLAQTLPPEEIIVVDDASTDDTVERVKAYGSRVRLIRCGRNSGGCGTPRNIGIDAAKTTYVAPFDSDDLMEPGKLQRHADTVKAVPEAGVYFTDFIWHNTPAGMKPTGPHCRTHTCFKRFLQPRGPGIYLLPQHGAFHGLMEDNFIGASTLLFSKSVWRETGGYDQALRSAEDLDFSLRLAERYSFGYVDEPLYRYRLHSTSMSSNRVRVLACAIEVLTPYLKKCTGGSLQALRHQIGEMEIDLTWHSIDAGQFLHAAQHWYRTLTFCGLRRPRLFRLGVKLAVHSALTARRNLFKRSVAG